MEKGNLVLAGKIVVIQEEKFEVKYGILIEFNSPEDMNDSIENREVKFGVFGEN